MSEHNKDNKPAAPAAEAKKVKIRTLRDCSVGGNIVTPNQVVLATEAEAKDLCDTKFPGYHPFYGHMPEIGPLMGDIANPLERREIVRAVRIA